MTASEEAADGKDGSEKRSPHRIRAPDAACEEDETAMVLHSSNKDDRAEHAIAGTVDVAEFVFARKDRGTYDLTFKTGEHLTGSSTRHSATTKRGSSRRCTFG